MEQSKGLKIIIADDHTLFREGLELLLNRIPFIKKVIHAENGQKALLICGKEKFDIILMDIEMPVMDGIMATRQIKVQYPHVKIIALTTYTNLRYILDLYDAGVIGYLQKNTHLDELTKAINLASQNEQYFCKEVADVLFKVLIKRTKTKEVPDKHKDHITERECEILKLICEQYSAEEIGIKLSISPNTVKRHKQRLFTKTDSINVAGLVIHAIKKGIFKVTPE
ncbi:MAG: response regulator transcription factor [Bacteroidia bacterium]|jgi:DNA-binding NarL/FixJ family response regulator